MHPLAFGPLHSFGLFEGLCLLLGLYVADRIIRAIVRWVNRRDDPRHAKLPPDPP
jgi:hypothetical protein